MIQGCKCYANANKIRGMSQIAILINRLQAEPIGLSQSEIARQTGIPQPRVSRWGSGDVAAGADDALKLVALAKKHGIEFHPGADAQEQPLATGA